ncbi:hypothetical protein TSAR_008939 [Trichomalopsis sarcophagae]|uniref:Retrovirus-related Pol polyprotein from transposon TNT 1-94-like beta-barrel domain-containing protein n=1 Tax=Trichomalopsis sarcophagae TaxID=543379 RepID=A0A232FHQ2_9HYME|nr:hypothetical protein TSAR_008939 [Trichomalopsis sarcophagae]
MVIRLLSVLPRFSAFRMAWECTQTEQQKKKNLIARLLTEDKRLCEEDSSTDFPQKATSDSKPVQAHSKATKSYKKKNIEELKKRTKCAVCKQKRHWTRECPNKNSSENKQKNAGAFAVSAYVSDVPNEDIWLADSGASMHMTSRGEFFTSLNVASTTRQVKIDGKTLPVSGQGTIIICERLNDIARNLFSITAINDKKYSFHSYEKHYEVWDSNGKLSSRGVRHCGLFKMLFKVKISAKCKVVESKECHVKCNVDKPKEQNSLKLWHEWFGHILISNDVDFNESSYTNLQQEDDLFRERDKKRLKTKQQQIINKPLI